MRAYFAEKGMEFELKKANADALPYEDATFDLVTGQTLLIHVPQPKEVLAEMKRVVKPVG